MILAAVRATYGFSNPNTAAALLVTLAVGGWIFWRLAWLKRPNSFPAGFALSLGLCAGWTALLIPTASRGALIALVAGLAGVWIASGCPRPRLWPAVIAFALLVALGGWIASDRMGSRVRETGIEDRSTTARLSIYSSVPAMIAAAPGGWGEGRTAEAYQNWYQPTADFRSYKHLISTHAIWLVERGWAFRIFYLFAWLAVLGLSWREPAAFGAWLAFGIAGAFNHIGGDWRLWVVPGMLLLRALYLRVRDRELRWFPISFKAFVAAIGISAILLGIGVFHRPAVFYRAGSLKVGGTPKLWFYLPDGEVLGASYGKALRGVLPVGVAEEWSAVAKNHPGLLVLSGNTSRIGPDSLAQPYDVVWINPPAKIGPDAERLLREGRSKKIIWGALRNDADSTALRQWFSTLPQSEWVEQRGRGIYVDNFLQGIRSLE